MYLYAHPPAPAGPRGHLGHLGGELPVSKRLQHFHTPKSPHPTISHAFVKGPLAALAPSDMNPGFFTASDVMITDTNPGGLQTCLKRLITTRYAHYLARPSNTAPSRADRLRVGLVDLTGDKLVRPDFAGWGSTLPLYGASVPKILAVYAAFQLRADLRRLASTQAITAGAALRTAALKMWQGKIKAPNVDWLFKIQHWSAGSGPLDFSVEARRALGGIMHNHDAGQMIVNVGFDTINSVTWQSGLHHPSRGGLWLSGSYGQGASGSNPVGAPYSANVTSLSVATYFTLLAQGRLVDDGASAEITRVLLNGCTTGLFPSLPIVAAKCGIYGGYVHDCALIDDGSVRFVVAGLTRTVRAEWSRYSQLFLDLHQLIIANNTVPRSACL